MSIKQKVQIKTFTGSGSFDVREEMLEDSKDMLDNIEVTDIAQQCVLLKDKEALKQVLLYHVVNGKVTSADVVKVDKANPLSGKDVKVTVSDSSVMINSSKVTVVEIMATNGVIHVIDTVLLPPADPSKEKMKKSY